MLWCVLILIAAVVVYLLVTTNQEADHTFYKWQLVDKTTERWARYVAGMTYIIRDTLMALEMLKKDEDFYS